MQNIQDMRQFINQIPQDDCVAGFKAKFANELTAYILAAECIQTLVIGTFHAEAQEAQIAGIDYTFPVITKFLIVGKFFEFFNDVMPEGMNLTLVPGAVDIGRYKAGKAYLFNQDQLWFALNLFLNVPLELYRNNMGKVMSFGFNDNYSVHDLATMSAWQVLEPVVRCAAVVEENEVPQTAKETNKTSVANYAMSCVA